MNKNSNTQTVPEPTVVTPHVTFEAESSIGIPLVMKGNIPTGKSLTREFFRAFPVEAKGAVIFHLTTANGDLTITRTGDDWSMIISPTGKDTITETREAANGGKQGDKLNWKLSFGSACMYAYAKLCGKVHSESSKTLSLNAQLVQASLSGNVEEAMRLATLIRDANIEKAENLKKGREAAKIAAAAAAKK